MRIFVAGATGIVGKRLLPVLRAAGHHVIGTARTLEKATLVRSLGAQPVIVDALDASHLDAVLAEEKPECVIHMLTSLPDRIDPERWAETLEGNARLRREGTRNLMAAALLAGAKRVVAQSAAWVYASGPLPHAETDPLDLAAEGSRAVTVRGVSELERHVLSVPSIDGVVLRFGYLYGPETWYPNPSGDVSLHIDAAVTATALAVTRGAPGVYNVVDDGGSAANGKARRELGWEPNVIVH
jgi:nucleoside-diphosphate-sugar epimerase